MTDYTSGFAHGALAALGLAFFGALRFVRNVRRALLSQDNLQTAAAHPACACAAIQAADPTRHFRECPRRALHPHGPAVRPTGKIHCGSDACNGGELDCYAEDACGCACDRCGPWNLYLESVGRK